MRIQILALPSVVVGDDIEEPFALIVDQVASVANEDKIRNVLTSFKEDVGARALLVTVNTVDVVDRYAAAVSPQPLPTGLSITIPDGPDVEQATKEIRGRLGILCPECQMSRCVCATKEKPPTTTGPSTAIYAAFYGKRMRIDWPDGPPPGLDRRKLNDHLNEQVSAAMQAAPEASGGEQ